jgi:intracellular multiplication protein IcmO
VVLAPPDAEALKASTGPVTAALEAIERGLGTARTEKSATLAAMLKAFSDAAAAGRPGMECVEAAIDAAGGAPLSTEEIAALAPHAPLQAMMLAAASHPPKAPSTTPTLYAGDSARVVETMALIESIELESGVSAADARQAAVITLGAGQAIEGHGAVRGDEAVQEVVRSIEALTADMVGAAFEAAAAEAREAASPRLVGATL